MRSWAPIARRIRVPAGFIFAAFYFWAAKPVPWSLAGGALVAVAGLLLRALASGHVTKNEALTTTGPYAYVRNPLYLGSVVTAAGFAVAARNLWIALAIIALFIILYLPVIRSEESVLQAKFPGFDEYVQHVPRLLPRCTPYGNSAHSFSWALYRKHREYNAVVGAVLMICALGAKIMWFSK